MVSNKFYKGYEGEPQIILSFGKNDILVIWVGYIYTLMEAMFDQNLKLLADFYSSDDNQHWEIKNISNAIAQFNAFDLNKIEKDGLTSISSVLPDVATEIADFLKAAFRLKQNVYISKD